MPNGKTVAVEIGAVWNVESENARTAVQYLVSEKTLRMKWPWVLSSDWTCFKVEFEMQLEEKDLYFMNKGGGGGGDIQLSHIWFCSRNGLQNFILKTLIWNVWEIDRVENGFLRRENPERIGKKGIPPERCNWRTRNGHYSHSKEIPESDLEKKWWWNGLLKGDTFFIVLNVDFQEFCLYSSCVCPLASITWDNTSTASVFPALLPEINRRANDRLVSLDQNIKNGQCFFATGLGVNSPKWKKNHINWRQKWLFQQSSISHWRLGSFDCRKKIQMRECLWSNWASALLANQKEDQTWTALSILTYVSRCLTWKNELSNWKREEETHRTSLGPRKSTFEQRPVKKKENDKKFEKKITPIDAIESKW